MKMRSRAATAAFSVAVLLAILAAMGFAAAAPYVRLSWLEQTIAQNQQELLELRKEMAREGTLRKENSELAAVGEDASLMLLQGETTGIAGANLQKLMSGLVLQHGGAASSIQILPTKEDGNLVRIPISLSISAFISKCRAFDFLGSMPTIAPSTHPSAPSSRCVPSHALSILSGGVPAGGGPSDAICCNRSVRRDSSGAAIRQRASRRAASSLGFASFSC